MIIVERLSFPPVEPKHLRKCPKPFILGDLTPDTDNVLQAVQGMFLLKFTTIFYYVNATECYLFRGSLGNCQTLFTRLFGLNQVYTGN